MYYIPVASWFHNNNVSEQQRLPNVSIHIPYFPTYANVSSYELPTPPTKSLLYSHLNVISDARITLFQTTTDRTFFRSQIVFPFLSLLLFKQAQKDTRNNNCFPITKDGLHS
ncbi:hypothetical protein DSO57_1010540 [Entomophthora muscae]|uniref:Uncharacterized protein n=1 Tax=Entomophthora muscae TaxID=34485 RepID=A0ACC2SVL7_9FUNG|nr:hypothetical protein DSO57_1010540 [Entomophthora muscae]